jgi:hypothetical protein
MLCPDRAPLRNNGGTEERSHVVLAWTADAATIDRNPATDVFVNAHDFKDADVHRLARMPQLARLELNGLRVSAAPLGGCGSLRALELTNPSTLDGLASLQQIESLTLYYLPHIASIEPIGELRNLRRLLVSTPPSYDASRKCHHVASLAPLAQLSRLEQLTLRGILPDHNRLYPLERLSGLRTLEVTHVFAFDVEDYAGLARALPATEGHCLVPYFEAHWTGTCRICAGRRVALTAPPPRAARLLCPACNASRLAAHVARWSRAIEGMGPLAI